MKTLAWMLMAPVALLAALAVACGDGRRTPQAVDGGAGDGLVRPNTFMIYDGQRYELVNMLLENMVPADEFQAIGVVTEADIDLGDMGVFERAGDVTAVYTYSPPAGDDIGLWLAWRATN